VIMVSTLKHSIDLEWPKTASQTIGLCVTMPCCTGTAIAHCQMIVLADRWRDSRVLTSASQLVVACWLHWPRWPHPVNRTRRFSRSFAHARVTPFVSETSNNFRLGRPPSAHWV